MNKEALAELFYRELQKVAGNDALDEAGKIEVLFQLLHRLITEVTRKEQFYFSTFFARLAYACHTFQLDKTLQFYLHQFRRKASSPRTEDAGPVYLTGLKAFALAIEAILETPVPDTLRELLPDNWPLPYRPSRVDRYLPVVRVLALEEEETQEILLVREENNPEEIRRVQYNVADRNELFTPSVQVLRKVIGFPCVVNLLEVEVGKDGIYRPRGLVLEPDYLIEVSAIAECFRANETDPWQYLLGRFLPVEHTPPLMLGNIANFFLDELMTDPSATYQDLLGKIFKLHPLAFSLFSDQEIRKLSGEAQAHFVHLKQLVAQDLGKAGILPEQCNLEPSFYSEMYGLQGRLDVLHLAESEGNAARGAIIELKSGKSFMPNIYGLSSNHFTQTLLYDLLIRSVFGKEIEIACYILYSGADDRQLRFAPPVKAHQWEALQVRNQMIAIDRLLAGLGITADDLEEQGARLFGRLQPAHFPGRKGFGLRDLALFQEVYQGMSPLDRRYFIAFAGFIAREQQLAKTGVAGLDAVNGLAALWLNSYDEKEAGFDVLAGLVITDNRSSGQEPVITFARTESTNPLANFRIGDIAVLYPQSEGDQPVLHNQIFKCTVVTLDAVTVAVRLRSRQFNQSIFSRFSSWNLEHDLLESGFTGMYRNLFEFARAPKSRRSLLLGQRPPADPGEIIGPVLPGATEEQSILMARALEARDYFLLWGPPGTGKTSVVLRLMVERLLNAGKENLLVLAYTNRAVDEICEAIEQIGEQVRGDYLRIGSRYASDSRFHDQLLQSKLEKLSTRKELKSLIADHRIIVGTVASVAGKPELLKLKKFDRVIVDEASQVLEPMLISLLAQIGRFILIGDHRQLPAVVTQPVTHSVVRDPLLTDAGFTDLRNSLFERLYLQCQRQGWTWAYGQLSKQGRMHAGIMAFPNEHFYEGKLDILPEGTPGRNRQVAPLKLTEPDTDQTLAKVMAAERVIFMPTEVDLTSANLKTNRCEAALIARLTAAFTQLYKQQDRTLNIGIITPYRAQIAMIRQSLTDAGIDPDGLTIDTVERYQGGARDVILISLCTNHYSQMTSLSAQNDEGVDRKLNVALTRAREHLVILGNPGVLKESPVYGRLMDFCRKVTI
ncbi:MAG TPA: AAA domain-containing protein [Flavilitoribacter sp.]|nr:AAA domain-containing protein [Flavilitoribacter sp.]HMQ86420.1 AAA domain-containing protein [Flavilitoribacter sp.]